MQGYCNSKRLPVSPFFFVVRAFHSLIKYNIYTSTFIARTLQAVSANSTSCITAFADGAVTRR